MPSVDEIVQLFQTRGESQYGGECVTQLEHALQAAALAENEQAADGLIAAALLHDIGHLLHDLPDDAPDSGIDDRHENAGYYFVRSLFSEEVTEPVRLHVPAKRDSCATEAGYREALSASSLVSLNLQGGPMTPEEVAGFRENPFAEAAVRLRRWDDAAKIPQHPTPPLEHFASYLRRLAREDTPA